MIKSVFFILFLALVMTCNSAFAAYKIILKNGSEFIVEDYKEVDGKIMFHKLGGEIEIFKDTIEQIKEVKSSKAYDETSPTVVIREEAPEEQQTPEKSADSSSKPEAKNKLKDIEKKKAELRAEKDNLDKEKKSLEEEIKKEGRVTSIRKMRNLEQQAAAIDEKIKKFNEELNKLNQEQEKLSK